MHITSHIAKLAKSKRLQIARDGDLVAIGEHDTIFTPADFTLDVEHALSCIQQCEKIDIVWEQWPVSDPETDYMLDRLQESARAKIIAGEQLSAHEMELLVQLS